MNRKIAIIGGGNLGLSIAKGLLAADFIRPEAMTVTRRNTAALQPLQALGVNCTSDNHVAVANSDVIILAVKPFQAGSVLEPVKDVLPVRYWYR